MKIEYDWDSEFNKLTKTKIITQNTHWTTQEGEAIEYSKMKTSHLINCFLMTSHKIDKGQTIIEHKYLFKELVSRNIITRDMMNEKNI
jgi:hypothetical protein